MNKKTAPRVQLNFAPEVEEPQEQSEDESLPVEVPQAIERDEIVENDIFDNPSLNGMGEDLIINEIQETELETPKPKPVKKEAPVKGKKKEQPDKVAQGYHNFCNEKRSEIKKEFPNIKAADITKKLSTEWKSLSKEEQDNWKHQKATVA